MSSGSKKKKSQKYQNTKAFNPTMHDTSHKTKQIMQTPVQGVCSHCRDVIKWKIQYKKYKPLTQPGKCVKCLERKVMQNYYTICFDCSTADGICAKCGKKSDEIDRPALTKSQQQTENAAFERELKHLPERKRRTLIRHMDKQEPNDNEDDETGSKSDTEGDHFSTDDED